MKPQLPLVGRMRRDHHVDLLAEELGIVVGMTHAVEFLDGALDHGETDLGVRHLATAEFQAEFYLGAVVEKALGVTQLGEKIVRLDAGGELDLLDLAGGRFHMARFLLLLVNVLVEVHDPADGRLRVRGDFDEVEVELLRQAHRLGCGHHPQLGPLGGNHPNLGCTNAEVTADIRERVVIVITPLILTGAAGTASGGKRVSHQLL
jgi:hypothetical protein